MMVWLWLQNEATFWGSMRLPVTLVEAKPSQLESLEQEPSKPILHQVSTLLWLQYNDAAL
jgi:hypothetical protein